MEPQPYRAPTYLDCPNCGETSPIDPAVVPIQCPECKHVLSAVIECGGCRERIPYQGDPKDMTACPKCGADPLSASRKWKGPIGSIMMLLGALLTIALIAITAYIMYRRFLAR
jgi:hypothetical protein